MCKTNPDHTREVKAGRKFTAICPQSQFLAATEQFGPYGAGWGLKEINRDFESLREYRMAIFSGVFWFKGGEFEISTSISLFIDKAQTKIDSDICKKAETDLVTKALSKIGFNADVFMGRFDDNRYVSEMRENFNKPATITSDQAEQIRAFLSAKGVTEAFMVEQWNLGNLMALHAENFQTAMDWIEAIETSSEQPENETEQPVNQPQDNSEPPAPTKSKPVNARQQYFKSVADDVKAAHMAKQPERAKVQPSGQVLSPNQFSNLKNALEVTGQSEQWLCQRMQVDSIGKIDSAYYPGIMNHLKKFQPNPVSHTVPVSNNRSSSQYSKRSEMYADMSRYGAGTRAA